MIYLWTFLAISILAVSCYIGQVMGAFSAVSSFTGMVILAALIYLLNVWLQDGDDIVSGLLLFLAPACWLIIRFMVGYGKR
ncbi:YfdY family protein [Salmonella enterica]|nr:YfdY family protein [Salmonella enterica]